MKGISITLGSSVLWTGLYFCFMLFYTFMNVAVFRKLFPKYSGTANLFTIALCISGFLILLNKAGYSPRIFSDFTLSGLLSSICCSILLFILIDNGLDRIFESLFPQSEQHYLEAVQQLINSPVTSFLYVCLFAPVIEEIFMRGFLLGGLQTRYGTVAALLLSSVLFGILHFNMVQGLSAVLCGMVLGLLYLKTNSILCCIIAHSCYNVLSCAAIMRSVSPPSE